ncbi:uncharacterized protein LOC131692287 [Topomyia yanbarensis]|uniref:uncharacterized protein LOC131692287 n=1 Tax=Topomyia yanbarensis TaxID=2498891 RepID=UPI00273B14A2|nr:uncharacterized protein LOC131692287 [Topomyia yanbarensis]XP_058835238.1 uncharacterized protein LOC131692287 [Topomyia yanbarensis]
MSIEQTTKSALFLPVEISLENTSCAICMEDANKPVFCVTCHKMLCFECMAKCQQENGCGFCRNKTPVNKYHDQCLNYSCEKHQLLVTLFCTECEVCVCKQCLNKGADHSLHSMITIEGIRTELAQKLKSLYSFLRLVEVLKDLDPSSEFVKCFIPVPPVPMNDEFKSMHEEVQSIVNESQSYCLKELVVNRSLLKNRIEEIVNKLKLKKQENKVTNDFESFTFTIDCHTSFSYDTEVFFDRYGNEWLITVTPKYGKMFSAVKYAAISINLKSGTPGRYEMKIGSSAKIIPFHRILEFMHIPSISDPFKIWERSLYQLRPELVLTLGVRRIICQCGNFSASD